MNSLDSLKDKHILVVGDVMLDCFWWGEVNRISPEAPVPIVRLIKKTETVGGAGNVASNIAGLGCSPILISVVGDDGDALRFSQNLTAAGVLSDYLIVDPSGHTTVKTRVIAHGQHVARIDDESVKQIPTEIEDQVIKKVSDSIEMVSAVVLSDYAKGVLSERVIGEVIQLAASQTKPVIVDPKGRFFAKYEGATILTPNKKEAARACDLDLENPDLVYLAGSHMMHQLSGSCILITEGDNGMTLFVPGREPFHVDPVTREVFDVTGAGDTVVAALAVAIANGWEMEESVMVANQSAGIAVEHVGTTRVTLDMLTSGR